MRQVFANKSMGLRDLWSGGDFPSPAPQHFLKYSNLLNPNDKPPGPFTELLTVTLSGHAYK